MPHPSLQSRVVTCDPPKHHGPVRARSSIDLIVMHCTAGIESASATIKWMNGQSTAISYHYVIDRNGTIYRMCVPELVAYHAGDSAWPSNPDRATQGNSVNRHSVGISWANRNDGEPLTAAQIESALWLCGVFMRENNIPASRVVGHYEVSPRRKTDPKPAMSMPEFRGRLAAYLAEAA